MVISVFFLSNSRFTVKKLHSLREMTAIKSINLYLIGTMAYGFAHAMPRAYRLKHAYAQDEPVDALVTDKIGYCCHAASLSPIVWPWYVGRDMRALEIAARRKRAEDYAVKEFP